VRVNWRRASSRGQRSMCIANAVCCSVLQIVAVCCSVLQCVAVCCSVLQCVVYSEHAHCSVCIDNTHIVCVDMHTQCVRVLLVLLQ